MSDANQSLRSRPWQLRIQDRRAVLFVGDLFVSFLSLFISIYFWASSDKFLGFSWIFIQRRVPPWFFIFPVFWLLLMIELYDLHKASEWSSTLRGIGIAALTGLGLYLLLFFYYAEPPRSFLPRRGVAGFLILASLLTIAWRSMYIMIFSAPQFLRRVLLVGGGRSGRQLIDVYKNLSQPPFFLTGIIDDDPEKLATDINGFKVLGTSRTLMDVIKSESVTDIIVAISGEMYGDMFRALLEASECGVEISRMPKIYEELISRVPIRILEADWILRSFVDEARSNGIYELGKRLMDIIGGIVGVCVMFIIFPFVGLAIFLDNGFPLFYAQERLGRRGQSYQILKFRTMCRDAEPDGHAQWAQEDDARTTRVGKILRKTHLDELPQIVNVLKGEMSLVGPRSERPELVEMFEKHVPFYRARLLVKPGITGWAQVNFGYASTIDETIVKLEYDLYYIKQRSLIMDLIILLRTPSTVLGMRGR